MLDQFLSAAKVAEENDCAVIKIEFNSRLRYLSHFPQKPSDELRIMLDPIDKGAAARKVVVNRESLRAPVSERANIHAIEFEVDAEGAALSVYFRQRRAFQVAPGPDMSSVVIAVPGRTARADCKAEFKEQVAVRGGQGGLRGSLGDPAQVNAAVPGYKLRLEPVELDKLMKTGRDALAKNELDTAIQTLTKVLQADDDKFRREAKELLGVARERKGQVAHARAEYQEYLKLYQSGNGADRVRSRLAAIEAKEKAEFERLRKEREIAQAKMPALARPGAWKGDQKLIVSHEPGAGMGPGDPGGKSASVPDEWKVRTTGSLSSYYYLNQGGRDFFVAPRQNLGWEKENIYQVYQNSILTSTDVDVRFEKAGFEGAIRFAGSRDNRFIEHQDNENSVSSLFVEGKFKDEGVTARAGRQSRYSDGVLGRFDGLLLSYNYDQQTRFHAVGGSPVERSRDLPFLLDRYFYGASASRSFFDRTVNGGLYFIEQRFDSVIDRQSIGTEWRFIDKMRSGFGVVDYDTNYGTLNSLLLTGNQMFEDRSSASFNFDYRHSPLIFTSNAMQGQQVLTLSELLKRYTLDEVEQYALDRTAKSYVASAGYSKPLGEHLQVNLDGTVTYMSSTKESGGIPAMNATGLEFYGLAQLIGSSVFREGDVFIGGVRYADTQAAHRYMLELSSRYPIWKEWRVNPMMRFGYIDYKVGDRTEYLLMPTLRTSYNVNRNVVLELEVGEKITYRETQRGREEENEFLILAGIRYDFSVGER